MGVNEASNMIEHLATTITFSNGKKEIAQKTTDEQAEQAKQVMVYTDMEIPRGIKSSLLGDIPEPFAFANLSEAKDHLNNELDDFEIYFANNPAATFNQPRLGKLNYYEWTIFHSKHFTHHFKQFGLLPDPA